MCSLEFDQHRFRNRQQKTLSANIFMGDFWNLTVECVMFPQSVFFSCPIYKYIWLWVIHCTDVRINVPCANSWNMYSVINIHSNRNVIFHRFSPEMKLNDVSRIWYCCDDVIESISHDVSTFSPEFYFGLIRNPNSFTKMPFQRTRVHTHI